jgi:hypothetical protein
MEKNYLGQTKTFFYFIPVSVVSRSQAGRFYQFTQGHRPTAVLCFCCFTAATDILAQQ